MATKPKKSAASTNTATEKTQAKKTTTPKKKTTSTKTAGTKTTDTNVAENKGIAKGKGKALVIVESPAKAKTINKYLGDGYIVRSSVGHIRDLPVGGAKSASKTSDPKSDEAGLSKATLSKATLSKEKMSKEEKAQQALVRRMGVDPENGWVARYEILPSKTKVIKELKTLAKDASEIYLATDLDREGEAIAWHLKQVIGGDDSKYSRVVFNEITKSAISEAFASPSRLNMDRVDAQQARRFLDRVVGFMVSPLLWQKVARGLSAGRVQSVATRLVVEREREIRSFVPEEYWQIFADTHHHLAKNDPIRLEAVRQNDKPLVLKNESQAKQVVQVLDNADFVVAAREQKPTQSKPAPPFITSTLQQAASTRLGFNVKKTMMLAQRLYESGHITYMRTDSTFLSKDAITAVRGYIGEQFGKDFLPKSANHYGSKENAQEAHEAIRPSYVMVLAHQLKDMERDAQRLYELIWRQFVACQMPPAKYHSITLTVMADTVELKAKGRVMVFEGYTKVNPPAKSDDVLLPDIAIGERLVVDSIDPSQHFTKPPARFTEASLVKELEKRGIGRPSTYASIISTIQERGYVRLENKRLYAEKMGDIVTDRLVGSFPDLMDYTFTAHLEDKLDDVATGAMPYKAVLDGFYGDFKQKLTLAKDKDGMRPNAPTDVPDVHCDLCGRGMQIRTGGTGVFLGCTGYHLPPKERCKGTKNLMPVEAFASQTADDDTDEVNALLEKKRCPKCNTAMDGYIVDGGLKLHVCGNNPDCDGYVLEKGVFETAKDDDVPTIDCDKCDGQMVLKTGRFGAYFACQSCDNTRKVLKNGEPAPPRMTPIDMPELKSTKHDDHFILREGAAGLFLAASKFPKVRETRPPKVSEIKAIKDKLPAKFHYLTEAPLTDDDGNPTILRWSRKSGEQYVGSEKDGKATKFARVYKKGRWVGE